MYGVLDVFALVTRGPLLPKVDAITQPSPVLKQMPISIKSFHFTIIHRSTGQAIDLRVRPAVYPKDFFELRKRAKRGAASVQQRERLEQVQRRLIHRIAHMETAELFEPPARYRVLMFGEQARVRRPTEGK
jgi:hypothetical protein